MMTTILTAVTTNSVAADTLATSVTPPLMGTTVGFYALAIVAIIASLRVIIHTNPVHALLSMIVSLLSVAGIFFSLGAPFAGALEIIVYAGAILVLFVFVVMMLNLGVQNERQERNWLDAKAWAVPMGLAAIIGLVVISLINLNHGATAVSPQAMQMALQQHSQGINTLNNNGLTTAPAMIGGASVTAKMVGTKLFTEYLLLVEIAGFLLLGALVAAYHLAKRSIDDEVESHNSLYDNTQPNAVGYDVKHEIVPERPVPKLYAHDDNATQALKNAAPLVPKEHI